MTLLKARAAEIEPSIVTPTYIAINLCNHNN